MARFVAVDLVSAHVHRALAYVRLLNDNGVDPPRARVEGFARSEGPKGPEYQMPALATMAWALEWTRGVKTRDAEPVTDYLLRMGWITVSSGPDNTVQLTELGRVFLRGLEAEGLAESPEWRVADVVLEPTDSLVYVHLTRVVANAGAGLLVDGYFKPEYVPWLVETTTLRRVLVSSRHRGAADDLKRMAVALATVPNAATLEVRETNSMELHDRCLVRADGTVRLLGASVNGVGKNLTAVIAPDPAVMRVYRDRYENLWNTATVVAPQPPGTAAQPSSGP